MTSRLSASDACALPPLISLGRGGLREAAVAVEDVGDGLLAEIPAKLEAAVGEDWGVDDGEAGAVGGGAGGGRNRLPDAHALGLAGMREAINKSRLRLDHDLHLAALRQPHAWR
jgi:hypothetical protein